MKNSNLLNVREISKKEQSTINGGDGITRAFFRYMGQVWAGIQAGSPHSAYGRYPGM